MEKTIIKKSLTEEVDGRDNQEYLENCFEAFLGALYLDHKQRKGVGEAY